MSTDLIGSKRAVVTRRLFPVRSDMLLPCCFLYVFEWVSGSAWHVATAVCGAAGPARSVAARWLSQRPGGWNVWGWSAVDKRGASERAATGMDTSASSHYGNALCAAPGPSASSFTSSFIPRSNAARCERDWCPARRRPAPDRATKEFRPSKAVWAVRAEAHFEASRCRARHVLP